eukprot:scpid98321/ scgid28282/ 
MPFRFALKDDIALLCEVAAHDRPFKHGSAVWEAITKNLKSTCDRFEGLSERTFHDRIIHLVKRHITGGNIAMKQSGTAEEYTQKDRLLDSIVDMYRDEEAEKKSKKIQRADDQQKVEGERELGEKLMRDAAATLREDDDEHKEPKPKKRKVSAKEAKVEELTKHTQQLIDLRKKELELKEKEIDARQSEANVQTQLLTALLAKQNKD